MPSGYHHCDTLGNEIDLVDQEDDALVWVLLQNLVFDQLASATLFLKTTPFPNHGIPRIQNNDNHIAAINHLLQLMKECAARLSSGIVLLGMLRALPLKPHPHHSRIRLAEPPDPPRTSAAVTAHSEPSLPTTTISAQHRTNRNPVSLLPFHLHLHTLLKALLQHAVLLPSHLSKSNYSSLQLSFLLTKPWQTRVLVDFAHLSLSHHLLVVLSPLARLQLTLPITQKNAPLRCTYSSAAWSSAF